MCFHRVLISSSVGVRLLSNIVRSTGSVISCGESGRGGWVESRSSSYVEVGKNPFRGLFGFWAEGEAGEAREILIFGEADPVVG